MFPDVIHSIRNLRLLHPDCQESGSIHLRPFLLKKIHSLHKLHAPLLTVREKGAVRLEQDNYLRIVAQSVIYFRITAVLRILRQEIGRILLVAEPQT